MTPDHTPSLAKRRRGAWVIGWARSVFLAVLIIKGVHWLAPWANGGAKNIYISFAIVELFPLLIGLLSAFFWRRLRPSVGQLALASLYISLMYLAGTVFFSHNKHVIGHIIFSLLFYLVIFGSACLGRALFKADPSDTDLMQ